MRPIHYFIAFGMIVLSNAAFAATGDRDLLQSKINDAIAKGSSQLQLEAKTYELHCGDVVFDFCLQIVGAKNLRVVGTPTLTKLRIHSPRSGAVWIANSQDLSLSGIEIDYSTPPFTQGKITSFDTSHLIYQVDPGYPEPNHAMFTMDIPAIGGPSIGFIHDSKGGFKGSSYAGIVGEPISLGNRTWKMPVSLSEENLIESGDRFSYGPRTSSAFALYQNTNITIRQVTVRTSPSLAFAVVGTRGTLLFDRITIGIAPGSGRILSSVADAFHLQNTAASVLIENCSIQGMGDDALNVYSTGVKVISSSKSELQLETPLLDYRAGDWIQITDSTRTIPRLGAKGELKIKSVAKEADYIRVTVEGDAQSVLKGDLAFNVNHAAPGVVLRNNTFGSFRGSLRLRSPGAQVLRNSFSDYRNARFLHSIESYWNEGPMTDIPFFSENTVYNGFIHTFGVNWQETTPISLSHLVPIYRLFQGFDHLYSTSASEGVPYYQSEGIAFQISSINTPGFAAIYRCVVNSTGEHILSRDPLCEGQRMEGAIGYISPTPGQDRIPLYRLVNTVTGHHLVTTDLTEKSSEFREEGILGYVW